MPKGNYKRTRNYATIVYPDSAPSNWLDILSDFHIQAFISPLHDSDTTNGGQEHKKEHYHVMVMFDSVKTQEQAEELFKHINGVGCLPLNSTRSYARYLCHLDDPNKFQYSTSDVVALGGADYMTTIGTMSDKFGVVKQLIQYINENDVRYFNKLVDYAQENNEMWFDCLLNHSSYFIKEYIKSRSYEMLQNEIDEHNKLQ